MKVNTPILVVILVVAGWSAPAFSTIEGDAQPGALSIEESLDLIEQYCVLDHLRGSGEHSSEYEPSPVNTARMVEIKDQLNDGELINSDGAEATVNWVVFDRNQRIRGFFESKDVIGSNKGEFNWPVICAEVGAGFGLELKQLEMLSWDKGKIEQHLILIKK